MDELVIGCVRDLERIWIEMGYEGERLREKESEIQQEIVKVIGIYELKQKEEYRNLEKKTAMLKDSYLLNCEKLEIEPKECDSNLKLFERFNFFEKYLTDTNCEIYEIYQRWDQLNTQLKDLNNLLHETHQITYNKLIPKSEDFQSLEILIFDLNKTKNDNSLILDSKFEILKDLIDINFNNDQNEFAEFMKLRSGNCSSEFIKQTTEMIEKLRKFQGEAENVFLQRKDCLKRLLTKLKESLSDNSNISALINSIYNIENMKAINLEIDIREKQYLDVLKDLIDNEKTIVNVLLEATATDGNESSVKDVLIKEEITDSFYETLLGITSKLELKKSIIKICGKLATISGTLEELTMKSKDPKRFTNRGGTLLKDEKERKRLLRQKKSHEEELSKLIIDWIDHYGDSFSINNIPIEEYLENQENQNAQSTMLVSERSRLHDLTLNDKEQLIPPKKFKKL
ncbi:MAG: hypothetical protein MHMPM18_000904 [Marteilia pararefringens]